MFSWDRKKFNETAVVIYRCCAPLAAAEQQSYATRICMYKTAIQVLLFQLSCAVLESVVFIDRHVRRRRTVLFPRLIDTSLCDATCRGEVSTSSEVLTVVCCCRATSAAETGKLTETSPS